MLKRQVKCVLATLLACSLAACSWFPTEGGLHKEGERMACGRIFWSEPITGHALLWHGVGDDPNEGFSLQNYWFKNDRLALGVGFTGVQFHIPGDRILGGEIEARLRYYYTEYGKLGLFADLNGGFQHTQSEIPPMGLPNNGTFGFGPGLEYRIGENQSIQLGAEFHHMSNAHGKDKDVNPAQNELMMWVGFALTW